MTALDFVAIYGHTDTAKLLLDRGANIDLADNDGKTALDFAAINGHLHIVTLLLDRGANINIADNGGKTALMMAVENDNIDTAQLLLDKAANINLANPDIAQERLNAELDIKQTHEHWTQRFAEATPTPNVPHHQIR